MGLRRNCFHRCSGCVRRKWPFTGVHVDGVYGDPSESTHKGSREGSEQAAEDTAELEEEHRREAAKTI